MPSAKTVPENIINVEAASVVKKVAMFVSMHRFPFLYVFSPIKYTAKGTRILSTKIAVIILIAILNSSILNKIITFY